MFELVDITACSKDGYIICFLRPYGILLPAQWYEERNPGLSAGGYSTCPISFQPETGSVSTPVLRSLQRFLPRDSLQKFPSKLSEVVDEQWDYHKYMYVLSFNIYVDHCRLIHLRF